MRIHVWRWLWWHLFNSFFDFNAFATIFDLVLSKTTTFFFVFQALCSEVYDMQISEAAAGVPTPAVGAEPCRFPKLEECAHFHYERVQLPQLTVALQTSMDQSLHSQHSTYHLLNCEGGTFIIYLAMKENSWEKSNILIFNIILSMNNIHNS